MTFTWNQVEKSPHDCILSILNIPEALRDKESVATKRQMKDMEIKCAKHMCVLLDILSAHLLTPVVAKATSGAQMLVLGLGYIIYLLFSDLGLFSGRQFGKSTETNLKEQVQDRYKSKPGRARKS